MNLVRIKKYSYCQFRVAWKCTLFEIKIKNWANLWVTWRIISFLKTIISKMQINKKRTIRSIFQSYTHLFLLSYFYSFKINLIMWNFYTSIRTLSINLQHKYFFRLLWDTTTIKIIRCSRTRIMITYWQILSYNILKGLDRHLYLVLSF